MRATREGGTSSFPSAKLINLDLRDNHFNNIRLLMALLVIWSHCFGIYYGSEANEPISLLLNGQYNAGNIAVRVFFIVSGFLITQSYVRNPNMFRFFQKRVLRIYPGFLAATTLCAFVIIPLFSTSVNLSGSEIAKIIGLNFLLQGYLPSSNAFLGHASMSVNGALWSIPFEFWCYIGVAGFGLIRLLNRRAIIICLMLALMIVKAWLDLTGRKPGGGMIGAIIGWPYLWFSLGPCFLAGMSAYLYRDYLPRSKIALILGILGLILVAHTSKLLCDFAFPVVTAYVTFYFAFSRTRMIDAAKYGDFSYGIYLYGFPIQQMLVGLGLPFLFYVPAAFLLSFAAGIASWYGVEQFFVRAHHPRSLFRKAYAN